MEPTSGNSAYGQFKPSSYQAPVEDIVAEYDKWDAEETTKGDNNPDDVYQHNLKMINRNRLDRNTGLEIPLSPKARTISRFIPSAKFKHNFDSMQWNTVKA